MFHGATIARLFVINSLVIPQAVYYSNDSIVVSQRMHEQIGRRDAYVAQSIQSLNMQNRAQLRREQRTYKRTQQVHRYEPAVQKIPSQYHIDVPFSSQAPFNDWSMPWQEACEEMALIMVDSYIRHQSLGKEYARDEILRMIAWEEQHGFQISETLERVGEIAKRYYGYETILSDNVTVEEIKRYVSQGHPVIIPTAGRELDNPYFTGAGPWYHMVVITGYDEQDFITNDPGTFYGHNYRYKHHVLLDAIHDWTGVPEKISEGPKRMLVLYKN